MLISIIILNISILKNSLAEETIINYEDGKKTDSVTGGLVGNTIKIFRGAPKREIPEKWKKLILVMLIIKII